MPGVHGFSLELGLHLGDEFCNLLSSPRLLQFSRTWACLYLRLEMKFLEAGFPRAVPDGLGGSRVSGSLDSEAEHACLGPGCWGSELDSDTHQS